MEKLNDAHEELKRVDHLIYVSLKYTRTVDVILNILSRTVDAYAFMVDVLIDYAKEQGKILHEPESAIERAELIKELFSNDDVIVDNMQLYLLERKLLRAKSVERENEYRRHVTMKTVIEGREEIVNIDIITNYYLYQRDFLSHVRTIIEGKGVIAPKQQEMEQPPTPAWMHEEKEIEDERPATMQTSKTILKPKPSNQARKRQPRPKKYKIQLTKAQKAMGPRFYGYERAMQEKAAEKAAALALEKKSAPKKAKPKKTAPKKVVKKVKAKKKR
jgi:hypothetical protein